MDKITSSLFNQFLEYICDNPVIKVIREITSVKNTYPSTDKSIDNRDMVNYSLIYKNIEIRIEKFVNISRVN